MNEPASLRSLRWPLLRSFAGWRVSQLGGDLAAGLTLAAIAIPEQMATARLGGLTPEIGLLALVAGAIGFALFGAGRVISVGADSTIAPIFAGALAALAASGSPDYARDAAALALGVGLCVGCAGLLRLGIVADLLSIPVMTGFLAGIAVHILTSQAPALLGVEAFSGPTVDKLLAAAHAIPHANPLTLALGFGVFAAMEIGERVSPRAPSALIALGVATASSVMLGFESRDVAVLGRLPPLAPHLTWPEISFETFREIGPLSIIITAVVMMQTAATSRSFPAGKEPDVNSDFLGVGVANLLSGLSGAFPVNASPPRTAVVVASGGVSQFACLTSAALALGLALYGAGLLVHVPQAALAGVLLFVARQILRLEAFADVWRRSASEFALILATMAAIVILPIERGVWLGIVMSILHGVWTTSQARLVDFVRIPGTSIWWPKGALSGGETAPGVKVVALQAPLSFLNAYELQRALQALVEPGLRLVVVEANALVEVDYTGAKILGETIMALRSGGVDVAFARLESLRAQASFERLGLEALIGRDHLFHSVEEAVRKLAPA
jgi:MFS superfamily sulfate permease-like transporter